MIRIYILQNKMKSVLNLTIALGVFIFLYLALNYSLVYARPICDEPPPPGDSCYNAPTQVKCCNESWSEPCTGPWQRVEYKECVPPLSCDYVTRVNDSCYTTDACYDVQAPDPYPTSNSSGLIEPGVCQTFEGGTCVRNQPPYKICCSGSQPIGCNIPAYNQGDCVDGSKGIFGTSCPAAPPPPTACTCTSWINGSCGAAGGCPEGQRRQVRSCTPDIACLGQATSQCVADSTCVAQVCVPGTTKITCPGSTCPLR